MTTLKDSAFEVRCMAAWALGEMGSSAKKAVPALRDTLDDDEQAVRKAVEEALAIIENQ